MISALLAVDSRGGMGYQGTLPWYYPEDLQHFKKLTMNNIVVMGRKTWDDPRFPKPLTGRTCYVVTNRPTTLEVYARPLGGEDLVDQVLRIEKNNPDKDIFIIGGPGVIQSCMPILDTCYLTHVTGSYKIDVKIDLRSLLSGMVPTLCSAAPNSKVTFVKYVNIFKRTRRSTD